MYVPECKNNVHLKGLLEFFGNILVPEKNLNEKLSYVFVCFTNRSGSNYLASIISENIEVKDIGEVFNFDSVIDVSTSIGISSFGDYFSFINSRCQSSGTVFIKVAIAHIELLARAGVLEKILPRTKFVLMTRGDKLGQAISIAIAFATQQYTSTMPGVMAKEAVPFSRSQIDTIISGIAEEYRLWYLFFGRNGIEPITVNYEFLVSDPNKYFSQIAPMVGLDRFSTTSGRSLIKKQRNDVNERWRKAYIEAQE